ncbi:glycosyltransferase family 4 protein [Trebonia kvetii]|uniref:glycosyltransferase family 4 protein n=1 Tax=Trebonia kvetii TaxID=2480626 RepID=UPI001FEAFF9C|nr:glycosyltransferase family 4 protein [Trebonia kvetii]
MATVNRPLRIALLSYRSKPHSGGQGVYVRHLSRELAARGHLVEVFSGQPYPDLDEGPVLREVPSLDLYRDDDPFRTPRLAEFRDWADAVEVAMMWGGAFPEPLTFSVRALRALRARPGDFDIVHDNQGLGYGMLGLRRLGLPLVTSIHHPITVDRRLDLDGRNWRERLSKRRWYGFVRMQGRVARRAGPLITVSSSSKNDICRDFHTNPDNVYIVPLGVDTRLFHPRRGEPRVPGRIVTVTSADSPLKGLSTLLRAVAKLATERDTHLVVVGTPSAATRQQVTQLALDSRVRFASGLPDAEYAKLLASAEVAVIPSMYEGFSLPAVEHMASGTPLIASRAGALPEVTGDAALLVTPGDAEELAAALRSLLDEPESRAALAARGLARVRERFAWPAVAAATEALYRKVINGETGC